MSARNVFFLLACALYLIVIILFALKLVGASTLIWQSLSMAAFVGFYFSSKPRDKK